MECKGVLVDIVWWVGRDCMECMGGIFQIFPYHKTISCVKI